MSDTKDNADMSKKLYFAPSIDDERCYTLDSIVDQMKSYSLSETEIKSAVKDSSLSGYFYCKHYGSVGESIEGACGKHCDGYSPRNGNTIDQAISDYCQRVSNCRVIFNAYAERREIQFPKLVHTKLLGR